MVFEYKYTIAEHLLKHKTSLYVQGNVFDKAINIG